MTTQVDDKPLILGGSFLCVPPSLQGAHLLFSVIAYFTPTVAIYSSLLIQLYGGREILFFNNKPSDWANV